MKEATTQWISVSSRLPEMGELVLVSGDANSCEGRKIIYRCTAKFQGDFRDGFGNTLNNVTHWQPMTYPPVPTLDKDHCPKCGHFLMPGDNHSCGTDCVCDYCGVGTPLLAVLAELVRQIEMANAVDAHGHPLKNLKALHDAQRLLAEVKK